MLSLIVHWTVVEVVDSSAAQVAS